MLLVFCGGVSAEAEVRAVDPQPVDPGPTVPTPDPLPANPGLSAPETKAIDDTVVAALTESARAASVVPGWRPTPVALAPPLVKYLRAEVCGVMSAGVGYGWPCSDGRVVDHTDVCGEAPVVLPLWRSTRAGVGSLWSNFVLVEDLRCAGGPVPSGEQVLSEFRR
ncbi:MAG: hypothetical protein L6311_04505, partial [Cellulomonas sp.]|nr:hypothetical protein [Cellulomonas sp.]